MSGQDKYYYLIRVQYLGFRFRGWQRQPEVKTIQEMIEKTFRFVLEHDDFKILGASRTDAMVSANNAGFELFLKERVDANKLLEDMNNNLPQDIRFQSIEEVDADFNIIHHAGIKEYHYLFSFGEKAHPFAASLISSYSDQLNIDLMIEGARLFEGTHNFKNYCYKPSPDTQFERTILTSEIVTNDIYTANFFPSNSYLYRVKGKGFMRHQLRIMMGALINLGNGVITTDDIIESLDNPETEPVRFIAPASGLILHDIEFDK